MTMHDAMEFIATAIEVLAVLIMVALVITATVKWGVALATGGGRSHEGYRVAIGRSLLIGLELLVAGDIIRTVAVDTTVSSVATLGVLVLIRIALGWSVTVEVEGRWPWQPPRAAGEGGPAPIADAHPSA